MSLGRKQRINNHSLLSAIAAALRKEGDRHCQKHLKMVSTVATFFFSTLYNARKCILNASKRAHKVHRVYFKFVMTVTIYLCKHPLQTEIQNYTTERSSHMSLFTYLSLWNSSNASSHAAPEKKKLINNSYISTKIAKVNGTFF